MSKVSKPKTFTQRSARIRRWFNRRGWADLTIATPYVWLTIFFLLPS
ncbi:MAG: hypothetical protein R3D56_00735 [Paracoccaceae bacterium]